MLADSKTLRSYASTMNRDVVLSAFLALSWHIQNAARLIRFWYKHILFDRFSETSIGAIPYKQSFIVY